MSWHVELRAEGEVLRQPASTMARPPAVAAKSFRSSPNSRASAVRRARAVVELPLALARLHDAAWP